jgi:nicotinic acid mononucleotide adenylyltransferase
MTHPDVVCSIQGAYAPPHKGHAGCAELIAHKLQELYPDKTTFLILFMPASHNSDKESICRTMATPFVTEQERMDMLNIYCRELNESSNGRTVSFAVSTIEYTLGTTATIHTLRKLKEEYPTSIRVLAMGEDNGRQLPGWTSIEEYPHLIDALVLVARDDTSPTAMELPGIKTHLTTAPPPFSSTAVRAALAVGDIETVRNMCGPEVLEYLLAKSCRQLLIGSDPHHKVC